MARYFDTPLSSDTQTRTLQIIEGIARFFGLLPPLPVSSSGPSPVATITSSIGTTGRDYSTISSWEADLDNGAIYSSGDNAVGECYNDSAFDEAVTINGGTTIGLAGITLTVPSGQRHDGTAGTGARIVRSGTTEDELIGWDVAIAGSASWLDLSRSSATTGLMIIARRRSGDPDFRHCLLHSAETTGNNAYGMLWGGSGDVSNTITYNIESSNVGSGRTAYGVRHLGTGDVANVTVHNIQGGDGVGSGIEDADICRNSVATSVTGTTAATCFKTIGSASYNASSDATASGTGSLTSIVTADQYVSTVVGSEDLHLKAGANCIDAGTDLSGSGITGISEDIDGNTRSGTWDIGADELEAGAGSFQAAWAMGATLVLGVAGGA